MRDGVRDGEDATQAALKQDYKPNGLEHEDGEREQEEAESEQQSHFR